jgi:branched-chain amino acid transport system ATP-binding protein
VPETRDAFSYLSVEENLAIARNPATRWDMDRIFAWFPALAELRARKGSQLSGGQQQMLVIGRGLLTGPELLLLDEPSQGLAPVIVNTVLDMLRDLKRERLSVLIVEQSLKLAMALADRVYIMSNGRIAFEGRPQDIEADPTVIDRFIGVNAA